MIFYAMFPCITTKDAELVMQLMLLLGGSLLYMVASSIILYTGLPPSQVGEPCLFSTWSVVYAKSPITLLQYYSSA